MCHLSKIFFTSSFLFSSFVSFGSQRLAWELAENRTLASPDSDHFLDTLCTLPSHAILERVVSASTDWQTVFHDISNVPRFFRMDRGSALRAYLKDKGRSLSHDCTLLKALECSRDKVKLFRRALKRKGKKKFRVIRSIRKKVHTRANHWSYCLSKKVS